MAAVELIELPKSSMRCNMRQRERSVGGGEDEALGRKKKGK
jgi:hypothetical protein